jgi:replicative DNA helicase
MQTVESLRATKSAIIDMEKGLVPPQAIDIEEAVIGAILIDEKGVYDAIAVIQNPNVFFKNEHVLIYEAIQVLFTEGLPIDLLTVSQKLKQLGNLQNAGGDIYLMTLTQRISSSAHTDYHCRILLQMYLRRMIIMFNQKITAAAYNDEMDVFDLISQWSNEFDKVADMTSVGRMTKDLPMALEDVKRNIELLSSNKDDVVLAGIHTGFQRINKYTGGYREQDLIILAARPGMGKTAKALKTALENIKMDVPVGIISGEMSMMQLTSRLIALDTNFHLNQIMKYGFEKSEYFITLQNHVDRMKKYPLYVDDSGKMDVSDVVVTIKNWHRKHGIKLVIIDYVQLMLDRSMKTKNRTDELASVSRRLKLLAKELNIPIILLAQVNRDCEKRGSSKRPFVSDIKDCGAVEQDADIIEFIYRPDYYKLEMQEEDYDHALAYLLDKGANTEIIFAKYRGGATGTTLLKWVGDKTKFIDVDDDKDTADYEDSPAVPTMSAAEAFGGSNTKSDVPF